MNPKKQWLFLIAAAATFAAMRVAAQSDNTPESQQDAKATLPSALAAPTPAAERKPVSAARQSDDRQITSSDIAGALAYGLPKFQPVKPDAKPEDEQQDEADKPKNQIIRLPDYVVTGSKAPTPTEKDVLTKSGLTDLAVKENLGELDARLFNRWDLFGSKEERALFMYGENQRLQNISDLASTARAMKRGDDPAEANFIKQQAQDTYLRTDDWAPAPNGFDASTFLPH